MQSCELPSFAFFLDNLIMFGHYFKSNLTELNQVIIYFFNKNYGLVYFTAAHVLKSQHVSIIFCSAKQTHIHLSFRYSIKIFLLMLK